MRRPRILAGALAVTIAAPLAGLPAGPGQATAPVSTVTTFDAPTEAAVGDTLEVTVSVTTDSGGDPVAAGDVYLDLAVDESELMFNGYPDTLLGPLALDPDGEAVFEVTVDSDVLPFLTDDTDVVYLAASFNPDDYDAYAYSTSAPGEIVLIDLEETGTEVTGPSSAVQGVPTTLSATVTPSDAVGSVLFDVDEVPLSSPVPVVDGVATAPYTFQSAGESTVRATFIPADSSGFAGSEDAGGLDVDVAPAPVVVPPPTATTTTVSAPASVPVGTAATLSATVSPAAAAGTVQFTVDGVPVGAAVAVVGGAASASHTFAEAGARSVGAAFTPSDPSAYVGSGGTATVEVSLIDTSIDVTGPASAIAGEETTLTATVQPADAAGTVQFTVDGGPQVAATVTDGAASAAYTFENAGSATVSARFEPEDADRYAASAAEAQLEVAPGATASTDEEALDEDEGTMTGSTCGAAGNRPATAARRDLPFPSPIAGLIGFFNFLPLDFAFQPLPIFTPWFDTFFRRFEALNFTASFIGLQIRIGPCGSISIGHRATPQERAEITESTVPCTVAGTGFECALPDLPANTEIEVTAPFGLPAVVAGRNLGLTGSLVGTDPVTGEEVTLGSLDRVIEVPKRTVLTASLSPAERNVTSVRRGEEVTYRVKVRNAGVVTADRVRTCVTVGRGAEILDTQRVDVHGRRACWTQSTLEKGKTVVRRLTLVPRRKGDLTLHAVVRPQRSQADVVRLSTALPVR